MPPAPDRPLRRLVARLAAMAPDDVAAILADLDPAQRSKVERLMRDYLAPAASSAGPGASPLSPWLAGRVAAPAAGMTRPTHAALQEAARRLFPAAEPVPAARSLLDRMLAMVAPR